jgi:hypothetical protein
LLIVTSTLSFRFSWAITYAEWFWNDTQFLVAFEWQARRIAIRQHGKKIALPGGEALFR